MVALLLGTTFIVLSLVPGGIHFVAEVISRDFARDFLRGGIGAVVGMLLIAWSGLTLVVNALRKGWTWDWIGSGLRLPGGFGGGAGFGDGGGGGG